MKLKSWISPKTAKGLPSRIDGKGFFATEDIADGELIYVKVGHVIDQATLEANREIIANAECPINDGLFLAPLTKEEVDDSMIYINHSCAPNTVARGDVCGVTWRDIAAGEELTIDYATYYTGIESFTCTCGAAICRGEVRGTDWQNPELQRKYGQHFSSYILDKIQKLKT